MNGAPSLRELQLRLRALIAAPRSHDDPERARRAREIAALPIRGDARLDATARLDIYSAMYFARLRDAIAEDYGALRSALGDALFDRVLRAYLDAHPPSDPSLRRAADHLATFVAAEIDDLAEGTVAPWVVELAHFEHALVCAFDAVDEPVLTQVALEALPADAWPDLPIRFVRSLVLLEPSFEVEELRARLLLDEAPPPRVEKSRRPGLRVWRQSLRVYFRRVDRVELEVLHLGSDGVTFAELCAHLEARADDADPAEIALGLLSRWLEDELLVDTATIAA